MIKVKRSQIQRGETSDTLDHTVSIPIPLLKIKEM